MKLADVSIVRPVFTGMMMLALVVFGIVLYLRLSVDLFPNVDFPIVTVTAVYPGADPETMETRLAEPIEEAVNSLAGIKMLRSVSLEGVAQVFVQFDLDVDLDVATQDVRDRVSSIEREFPQGVEYDVAKLDVGAAPVMQLAIYGPADPTDLARYAEDVLKPALERVEGVGQLELIGSREREMQIFIDPEALRAQGLTVLEVSQAMGAQNVDFPGGRITRGGQDLVVRTNAQARSPDEMGELVLATVGDSFVRVRDVATVVDGYEERRSSAEVNGEQAIAIVIRKQSGKNTVDVAEAVKDELAELEALGPPGTTVEVLLDNSKNIRASIESVQLDLVIGAILAVLIIFFFLRDIRATFISALALPTSVIGTFGFVTAMGFTLNMMTTLALSLSIGILIDDAIVVIENIVRHRTDLKEGPREAAHRGTAEIGLAVLATTLSIVAVFVPVAFMEGMVGQFFYEFGLTVAFAVLLSLFVSFTLTPMLSARLLKAGHGSSWWLSRKIEGFLTGLERFYRRVVSWALRHRIITLVASTATLLGAFVLVPFLGFEFLPPQDTAQFNVIVELPTGTSLEETEAEARDISETIRGVAGVKSTFTTVGGGVEEKVNSASILVTLIHRSERNFWQKEAEAVIRRRISGRPGVKTAVEELQIVSSGAFRSSPIQYNLRGNSLEELDEVGQRLAAALREQPGFVDVDTSFRTGKPQLNVDVDRTRAADLGVMGIAVGSTVRSLIAGQIVTQFDREGDRYDVRLQLPPEFRNSREVIERAQVRTQTGALVDIGDLADVEEGFGPSQIDREGRQRQVTVLANLEDLPLGNATQEVERLAGEIVPDTIDTKQSGMGELLQESMVSMGVSLFLAIICIYMILASQFESLLHPFTIMTALPFSFIGAFGGLFIMGMHMSIYTMIGIIMLMGLVTKNGILLVDFANQLRQRGQSVTEALENAGVVRLRPILMTTAAMVFGMIPVAIGHGDGGEVRAPMGVTVIGGLITSTVLTLVVVPVIYTIFEALSAFIGRVWRAIFPAQDGEDHGHGEPVPGEAEE